MEEDLVARLRAAAGIVAATGKLGPPIVPTERPAVDWEERYSDANSAFPALTLQDVSPGRSYTHGGAVDLGNPVIQFDCWGRSAADAKALAAAVIAEMETPTTFGGTDFSTALLVGGGRMPTEDLGSGLKVFRHRLDFQVWSSPAS